MRAIDEERVFIGLGNIFSSKIILTAQTSIDGFRFSRDLGERFTIVGNAAGGNWNGYYRWLELSQNNQNLNFVMFNMLASADFINDPVFGNRTSKPYMIVARGNASKQRSSLQLNLTTSLFPKGADYVEFVHKGSITVGNGGAATRESLITYIKEKAPYLVTDDNLVHLGTIKETYYPSINDPDVANLLLRTAIYAYYRDQFRAKLTELRRAHNLLLPRKHNRW